MVLRALPWEELGEAVGGGSDPLGALKTFVGRSWDVWSKQDDILALCPLVRCEEEKKLMPRSYFEAAPLRPLIQIVSLGIGFHASL